MATDTEPLTNAVLDLLNAHVSVRRFTDEPVSDEMVMAVLNAARRAPTSSNWQTYSIIVVRDPRTKAQLADLAGGQGHIIESQVFVAFAADLHRLEQAASMHDSTPAQGLEHTLTPIIDAAIVGEAAQIAAESFGLGAVMVGGMRRRADEVAALLNLPPRVFVVYGMSIGWPAGDPLEHGLKPRLPEQLVIHRERYADAGAVKAIARYDEELAAFYRARGRNLDAAAWSGPIATRSANLRYATLRQMLEAHGFGFD